VRQWVKFNDKRNDDCAGNDEKKIRKKKIRAQVLMGLQEKDRIGHGPITGKNGLSIAQGR